MKKSIATLLLLLIANTAFCKTYLIHSEKEYNDISQHIKAGDEVIIANGTYSPWALIIATTGTAKRPVTIQAETAGQVIFSGDATQPIFKLTGSYTVLQGITFTSCQIIKEGKQAGVLVELNSTQHCRITACTFHQNVAKSQFMPLVIVSGNGRYNQVDHCTFSNNTDNQELQVKITQEAVPEYTLIANNEFRDKPKVSWKVFNGGECIQIGQDPVLLGNLQPKTMVRDNYFLRCSGEAEVISNKSSNNIYLKNYFEDCDGELVMRGGNDCMIDSNIIKGGNSGIRVNGTGHQITYNNISNVKTAIRLMYGMAAGKTDIGFYIAASNVLIEHNHIENTTTGILIGDSKNADWTGKFDTTRYPSPVMQNIAPFNNTVGENTFIHTQNNVVTQ